MVNSKYGTNNKGYLPTSSIPTSSIPILSIPILSIPIWSMLTKRELTKWELMKWEVDKVGTDKVHFRKIWCYLYELERWIHIYIYCTGKRYTKLDKLHTTLTMYQSSLLSRMLQWSCLKSRAKNIYFLTLHPSQSFRRKHAKIVLLQWHGNTFVTFQRFHINTITTW